MGYKHEHEQGHGQLGIGGLSLLMENYILNSEIHGNLVHVKTCMYTRIDFQQKIAFSGRFDRLCHINLCFLRI